MQFSKHDAKYNLIEADSQYYVRKFNFTCQIWNEDLLNKIGTTQIHALIESHQ